MSTKKPATLSGVLWLSLSTFATAAPEALSPEQTRQWMCHLVPLPRQISLEAAVTWPVAEVRVLVPDNAPPLVGKAAQELREILGEGGSSVQAGFTIALRLADASCPELKPAAHRDQAYLIRPTAAGDGLELIGGGERGVYYASKTLQQLLRARLSAGKVCLPLLTVVDWPDLEDRGLWGGDSYDHLRWMSDRKMNIDEQIAFNGVDPQGRPHIRLQGGKRRMIDEGPAVGIRALPVVLHLEQLSGSGLFQAYPDLRGRDATHEGAICYSDGRFTDVLARWLVLWRDEPGVSEVDVWMAENLGGKRGCQCDGCRPQDRNVLEARVIVEAWNRARKERPDLGLRILTSEETEKSNETILAELPPEVKLWYYHSLFTYNTSRSPMVRPYLVKAARAGRWVGICCNICPTVQFWQPFTGAAFIHSRMNEFADKGMSGLLGYATPNLPYCLFNTEAAAEWSWNARGRSTREFAYAFAVRQGLKDPELFVEWSEALGPVGWDVYGSEYPAGERRKLPGAMADLLRKGKLPELGEVLWGVYPVPWGDIKSVAQLEKDVTAADRALELARKMGIEEYLQETLVIQGYIHSLKALWELKKLVRDGKVTAEDKAAATGWFKACVGGLDQSRAALPKWERALPIAPRASLFVSKPVETLGGMIDDMKALAAELGCAF